MSKATAARPALLAARRAVLHRPVRYAIVGASKAVGPRHVEALAELAKLGLVEIVALIDLDLVEAEALKQEHCPNAELFTSQDAMYAAGVEVDVEIIATPTFLHKDMALKAFEQDHHVGMEKPFAMSASEAAEIFAAADAAGVEVYPLMQRRLLVPKAVTAALNIGTLRGWESHWLRADEPPLFLKRSPRGMFSDLGAHELSELLQMIGHRRPLRITGWADHLDGYAGEITGRALITFEDNFTAFIEVGCVAHHDGGFGVDPSRDFSHFALTGRGGTFSGTLPTWEDEEEARIHQPGIVRWLPGDRSPVSEDALPVRTTAKAHIAQHRELLDWVLGEGEPSFTRDQVMTLMKILDGFYKSVEDGKEVELA